MLRGWSRGPPIKSVCFCFYLVSVVCPCVPALILLLVASMRSSRTEMQWVSSVSLKEIGCSVSRTPNNPNALAQHWGCVTGLPLLQKGEVIPMTIPLPHDVFKVPRGYDDPWQRQQDQMQYMLHQLAPLTPDGGRHVLWCCPLCHQHWVEKNTSSTEEH